MLHITHVALTQFEKYRKSAQNRGFQLIEAIRNLTKEIISHTSSYNAKSPRSLLFGAFVVFVLNCLALRI